MYILKSTSSNFSTKTSLRLYLIYYDLRYRFFWDHRLYLFEFKFVVLSPRDNDIIADGLIYIIANRCFHWSQVSTLLSKCIATSLAEWSDYNSRFSAHWQHLLTSYFVLFSSSARRPSHSVTTLVCFWTRPIGSYHWPLSNQSLEVDLE